MLKESLMTRLEEKHMFVSSWQIGYGYPQCIVGRISGLSGTRKTPKGTGEQALARELHDDVAHSKKHTRWQRLCEEVRQTFRAVDQRNCDVMRLHLFAYKEVAAIDVCNVFLLPEQNAIVVGDGVDIQQIRDGTLIFDSPALCECIDELRVQVIRRHRAYTR
eukprot:6176941-Pleurochrysis_carterae.AAC.2